jgi:hypothetical protein
MEYIIEELVSNVKIISPSVANITKFAVNNLKPPNLQKQDEAANKHNKKLLKKAFTVLGIVLIIGIIISFSLSRYYKFSFTKLLLINIISLAFVAMTEFSFLTFFGRNYKSADPNTVKKALFMSLKKYSK